MGKQSKFSPEEIENFKNLTVLQLRLIYPDKSYQYLRSMKVYYMEKQPKEPKSLEELQKLSDAFKDAGLDFSPEDLAQADRAGFHVGYIRNADGEIEYTKPLPHVDFGNNKNKPLLFQAVEPREIKPFRGKLPRKSFDDIIIFSDAQIGYRRIDGELIPMHHEPSINAALKFTSFIKPKYLIDAGDTTDFGELGRFGPSANHFEGTLQPSLQRTHDMYAQFTAASPKAERYIVDSNHVKRLGDFVIKNAYPLYNIKAAGEKYPALSYPSLLKLDEIGWNFIGGYGAAEYDHKGRDDLAVIHGTFAVSNGSTAAKLAKANYGRNIVQGHKHSIESHYHTDRRGRQFGAFVVGALCRRDGVVPSYHSAVDSFNQPVKHYENWQNGIMYIKDYGEGRYQFEQIPIVDGVIYHNGKEFNGNV